MSKKDTILGDGLWRHAVNTHAMQMFVYIEKGKDIMRILKSTSTGGSWIVTFKQNDQHPQRSVPMDAELSAEEVKAAAYAIHKMGVL